MDYSFLEVTHSRQLLSMLSLSIFIMASRKVAAIDLLYPRILPISFKSYLCLNQELKLKRDS